MNDNEREFDKMLLDMEAEVLALKTAHQRPLGALNFFRDSLDFTVVIAAGDYGKAILITVNIETPTAKPPIVQAGWEIPNTFYDITILDMNVNANYDTWTYKLYLDNDGSAQNVPFNFAAISSQPILSIDWSYTQPWT